MPAYLVRTIDEHDIVGFLVADDIAIDGHGADSSVVSLMGPDDSATGGRWQVGTRESRP
jgi:hypothetical protein